MVETVNLRYFAVHPGSLPSGYPKHVLLKPHQTSIAYAVGEGAPGNGPGVLCSTQLTPPAIVELRQVAVPLFMQVANINNLTTEGFRLVVDIFAPPDCNTQMHVHLIAGRGVAHPDPQDWLLGQPQTWDPTEEAPFYEHCLRLAEKGGSHLAILNVVRSGMQIDLYYEDTRSSVFGVSCPDPKSDVHFWMLCKRRFASFLDSECDANYWNKLMADANRILRSQGISGGHIRMTINAGAGYQRMPFSYMEVQSRDGYHLLPSMFPLDYGFRIRDDGTIFTSDTFPHYTLHGRIIKLIVIRRKVRPGNVELKQKIDNIIFDLLEQINALNRQAPALPLGEGSE